MNDLKTLLSTDWFLWGSFLIVLTPILFVLVNEITHRLQRQDSGFAVFFVSLRNLVLPMLCILILLHKVLPGHKDTTPVRPVSAGTTISVAESDAADSKTETPLIPASSETSVPVADSSAVAREDGIFIRLAETLFWIFVINATRVVKRHGFFDVVYEKTGFTKVWLGDVHVQIALESEYKKPTHNLIAIRAST